MDKTEKAGEGRSKERFVNGNEMSSRCSEIYLLGSMLRVRARDRKRRGTWIWHSDGRGDKLGRTYCLICRHRRQGLSLGVCIHRIRQGWTCAGDQDDQDQEEGHRRR